MKVFLINLNEIMWLKYALRISIRSANFIVTLALTAIRMNTELQLIVDIRRIETIIVCIIYCLKMVVLYVFLMM